MLKHLIDRPIAVTMGLISLIVLGIVAIRQLPVSLIPELDIPHITVQVSSPNMSSNEIDQTVLRPLRNSLLQMSDIEEIHTEARDGEGTIQLDFSQGTNMDYSFIEANEIIDRLMGNIGNVDRPKVLKYKASDIPAFYVDLSFKEDNRNFSELSDFAVSVISKRIEQLPQVAMVDISGYTEPEITVIPDEGKMHQAGISLNRLEKEIASANIRLGSLSIRDGEYTYNVKFQSFASSKEDIENIYINSNGRIFQLKDLATVKEQTAQKTGLIRSQGRESVSLAVIKNSDSRMSDLKDSMKKLQTAMSADYPDISFEITRDQTELLEYSIKNLLKNIIIGILLSCIIIFLFMQDLRSPSLVALAIPTSLIISMLVFYVSGLTINIISLSGLILGVGMMVDNTIILTDNITSRWQRSGELRRSVLEGTKEVTGPMLSSILTTCAVFLPLIFLNGISGAMFHDQAISISIVLLCSYLVTITFIPVYYWELYKNKACFEAHRRLTKSDFSKTEKACKKGTQWLFRHKSIVWATIALSAVGIFICLRYMPKTRLPEISYSDTVLTVNWNTAVSLEVNVARTAEIEEAAQADYVTSFIGTQQFLLSHHDRTPMEGASIYLKYRNSSSLQKGVSRINDFILSKWPEAEVIFHPSENIFNLIFSDNEYPLTARIRPSDGHALEAAPIKELIKTINSHIPESTLSSPATKTDVIYIADPESMILYGVEYSALFNTLKSALSQNSIFSIIQGHQKIPVVLGNGVAELDNILTETMVKTEGGDIPLSALMKQTWKENLKTIISDSEGNYCPVDINVKGRKVIQAVETIKSIVHDNPDYEVSFSGSYFTNRWMIKEMIIILLIAILLLYLILAVQFESLIQPMLVLSELIVDIFFSMLALWVSGTGLNIISLIGLIVVCGIVINDSILKIDTINKLRLQGKDLEYAIKEGGRRRLKAIIMTSLTTILAVCPFLLRTSIGDDLQYPMSLVIIAGMTVGTLASIFFVPLLYHEIYKNRE